jgi:large subunit ribosomal protein L29
MATDFLKDIRSKSESDLKTELTALRKEQFNLRMSKAMGQMNQSHLVRDVRKKIAKVKTVMQQQTNTKAKAS